MIQKRVQKNNSDHISFDTYVVLSEYGDVIDFFFDFNEFKIWFDSQVAFKKVYVYEIDNYELKARLWDICEK